jgi:CHAT domain-containing protein/Flp pilus assembly protein TadD
VAGPARAQGYVPHADTTDWRWWLHLAQNVSRQGNADAGDLKRGQDSAHDLARAALEHARRDPGAPPWAASMILTKQGEFCYMAGRFADAGRFWDEALAISDTSTDQAQIEREEALFRLAILLEKHPEIEGRTAYAAEATDLLQKTRPGTTPDQAGRLYRLAHVYVCLEHADAFYQLLERVIRIHEAHPDSDPRWAVRALVFFGEKTSKPVIAQIHAAKNRQDSSIAFAQYALDLSEAYFGPDDTLTAFVLYRLGDYHDRRGDFGILDSLWGRAWRVFQRSVPPEHIEYQGGLTRMGGLALARGNFVEAERMFKEALRLRIDTQGPGHPETAAMWTRVGRLFQSTARYDQADSCYRQALAIHQHALEQVESNTAGSLSLLGGLCFDRGDYPQAESYYRQSYEIRLRVHGLTHARTASSLSNLAQLYLAWGNFEEAERCLERALAARIEFQGARHPDVARGLDLLAEVQLARGKVARAAQSLARADSIRPRDFSLFTLEMADHYRLQGELKYREGDMYRAGKFFARSRDEAMRVYSDVDPRIIPYLVRMARHESEAGAPEKAVPMISHALHMRRDAAMAGHPYFALALECYAGLLAASGRYDSALAAADTALQIRMRSFAVNAAVMPERDALMYRQSLLDCRDRLIAIYFAGAAGRPAGTWAFPLEALAIKGAVGELAAGRRRHAAAAGDHACAALEDTLLSLLAHAFELYNRALTGSPDSATAELTRVMEAIHELERRQVHACDDGPGRGGRSLPSRAEMRNSLRNGEALLEYIRYRCGDHDRYAAVVMAAQGDAHAADLGEAARIDEAVAAYRRHMLKLAASGVPAGDSDRTQYGIVAGALTEQIWKPVAPWLAGLQRILIVPDGALNLVSFAGLPAGDERYLVEDVEIHYLNSVRAGVDTSFGVKHGSGLLALGDPDFDASPQSRRAACASSGGATAMFAGVTARNVRSSCPGVAGVRLAPLPGTERELSELTRLWTQRGSGTLRVLSGPSASEDLFKHFAAGSRVLHLATHGYYALGQCTPDDPAQLALHRWVAHENPLLLSGIYLAGANLNGKGAADAGVDDGILTAAEVSGLDLSAAEVVVLSSCESGVGDVRSGEGVYDLRRAFMQAGAAAVVSALWPVSDDEAAAFIGALYSDADRLLSLAMREAALERLADLRRRRQPDHPFEWAGFVATGDRAGFGARR